MSHQSKISRGRTVSPSLPSVVLKKRYSFLYKNNNKSFLNHNTARRVVIFRSVSYYLFGGLMSIGHTRVIMPADGNCEIRTRHGFFDAFVTAITGGVFSVQTIKVNAPARKRFQPQKKS